MKNGKVSVIVPVYNVEKYVGECIESIITQTYTNLEILINNDGSTDGSYEICESYAEKDSRIRLFTQENKGVAVARNAMLEKVTGDYILFVDSDDCISPDHVERLVTLLNDGKADGAACSYIEQTDTPKKFNKKRKQKIIRYTGKEFANKITWLLGYRCFPWGRLLKKESWNGITFPEGRIFEDMFAMPEVALRLNSIIYTNEPLYFYRHHEASLIHSSFEMRRTDELDGYIHFTKLGMENNYIPLIRNGAIFFVLVYIKIKVTMLLKGLNTKTYNQKYSQYFRMYLSMVFTGKYKYNELVFRELQPLR